MLVLFQLQIINNGSVRFSKCYDVYIVAEEFDLTDVYVRECRSVRPPVLISYLRFLLIANNGKGRFLPQVLALV